MNTNLNLPIFCIGAEVMKFTILLFADLDRNIDLDRSFTTGFAMQYFETL